LQKIHAKGGKCATVAADLNAPGRVRLLEKLTFEQWLDWEGGRQPHGC